MHLRLPQPVLAPSFRFELAGTVRASAAERQQTFCVGSLVAKVFGS